MLPVLPPRTLVLGLRLFRRLKPGQVVVVIHDGKEKIKRIDQIKDNQIFVLGDHGDDSADSRHFGWLEADLVEAIVIWPRTKRLS